MAAVPDIQNQFLSVLHDCRSLFTHSQTPVAPHTAAGIESAFLEAFKAWEVFLEEITIAYLTGESDLVGNIAPTTLSVSNPETCRTIINDMRPFGNWANPDWVKARFEVWFTPGTLDAKLNFAMTELKEIAFCRDAIAHSSGRSYARLIQLWTSKAGTSRTPLRTADVLLLPYRRNPPFTWFDRYLQVLEVMSQNLTTI